MKKIIPLLTLLYCFVTTQAQIIRQAYTDYSNVNEVKEPTPFVFKKRNMIALSVSDFVFSNITVKYEYFTKDGKIGLQVPFSFNAGSAPNTTQYKFSNGGEGKFLFAKNRIFQTGLNFNYYITGQDKAAPFVGASFAFGWFNYWNYPFNSNPTAYNISEKLVANNTSFVFHAGYLFNPWETFTVSLKGGIGLRRYTTIYQEYTYPFGLLDLSAGFKF